MKNKNENPARAKFDNQTEKEIQAKSRIQALTNGQADLMDAIDENVYIICNGPAGCGKTYISLAKGLEQIKKGQVDKLLLIRPTEVCGDDIGFLPGDKNEKVAYYMAAFQDLFCKLLLPQEYRQLVEQEKIIVDICQFMRGRTFDRTFIVVDEAQNYHKNQLKMLLTRLGEDSKLLLVGDTSQSDLDPKNFIGFRTPFEDMIDRLKDLDRDNIEYIELYESDIVRGGSKISNLIRKITKIYQNNYN
jgi:phosphate starvation-inducible PhoH-like protein